MIDAGLSATSSSGARSGTPASRRARFATIPCPSWMLGTIEKQAGPENAGKWDVARVPGDGAVRGGSFLAVPTQSKHQKEAAELAKFLTSPKGQTAAFKAKNNFPSSPQAIDDPAVSRASPTRTSTTRRSGKIFGESVKALRAGLPRPGQQRRRRPRRQRADRGRAGQAQRRTRPGRRPSSDAKRAVAK